MLRAVKHTQHVCEFHRHSKTFTEAQTFLWCSHCLEEILFRKQLIFLGFGTQKGNEWNVNRCDISVNFYVSKNSLKHISKPKLTAGRGGVPGVDGLPVGEGRAPFFREKGDIAEQKRSRTSATVSRTESVRHRTAYRAHCGSTEYNCRRVYREEVRLG